MTRNSGRIQLALCIVPLLWGAVLAPVAAQSSEEQALEAVREEIRALERRVVQQHVERDAGYRALRSSELAISASTSKLRIVQQDLGVQRERVRELEADTVEARARLAVEREALTEQVRANYFTGRQELLRLLLNQENPARLGRAMVYYDYLNQARSERVIAVNIEIEALLRLARSSEREAEELVDLEETQTRELAVLGHARDERQQLIARIEREIVNADNDIQRLREEERRLTQLVVELEGLMVVALSDPNLRFGSVKGELPWPISGSVINDYGDARAGDQLKWNGVIMGAPAGTPVRTVYHGRVVYADWLPGLGLLVIVDHGDAYMSLYGHNETILKELGDWVAPGEVIAQVGDSGGQSRNALHFEIRRNGEPIDPRPWMIPRTQR